MKIRNGFVSNSSSSSFLISHQDNQADQKIEITVKMSLSQIVETEIKTEDELIEHLNDSGWYETKEELIHSPTYKKCMKEIKEGRVVSVCCVSNEEGGVEQCLYDQGINQSQLPEGVLLLEEEY